MNKPRLIPALITVAALAASPAWAAKRHYQPPPPVVLPGNFTYHGDDFILPTPAGFCTPSGIGAAKLGITGEEIAQNLFTRDRFKIRGLLVRCTNATASTQTPSVQAPELFMVGVVPLNNKVASDRLPFLAGVVLRSDPDPHHPNRQVTLDPTMQYLGWDNYGVYMGARLKVAPSGEPEDVIEMIGATLVKQRVIGVVFTTPIDASTDLEVLKLKLQAEMRSFVELNEVLEPPIDWTPKKRNRRGSAAGAGSGRRRRAGAGSSIW